MPLRNRRQPFDVIEALYILAALVVLFVLSGVVPRYRAVVARRHRVEEFERRYGAYCEARERDFADSVYTGYGSPPEGAEAKSLRSWLIARRDQMQHDAEAAGRGVMYIAPPPMIGGGYQAHAYFRDLFDEQTNSVGSTSVRRDDLASIVHETRVQQSRARRDLCNPWAWLRLSFERFVRLPAYVLRVAGFGTAVTGSAPVRISGVVVGLATVGAFVVGLLSLLNDLNVL